MLPRPWPLRRFEVLAVACALSVAFILVVWAGMFVLKAVDPATFHFKLLMAILPWVTPVAIVLLLAGPLYYRVAGILGRHGDWPRALAEARYGLLVGSLFYLLAYTALVWAVMVGLRAFDGYDFHYNLPVDWLPAILPPWLLWLAGAPVAFRLLGVLGGTHPDRVYRYRPSATAPVGGFLGALLLTAGGLVLNEGMYGQAAGTSVGVQLDLIAFGAVVLTMGAICWAVMLVALLTTWRVEVARPPSRTALDRFRRQRGRLVAEAFVLVNLLFAACDCLMVAAQYVDAHDFHYYLALDMWQFGVPLGLAWIAYALGAVGVPRLLAARHPERWGPGVLEATGPSGGGAGGWGFRREGGAGRAQTG